MKGYNVTASTAFFHSLKIHFMKIYCCCVSLYIHTRFMNEKNKFCSSILVSCITSTRFWLFLKRKNVHMHTLLEKKVIDVVVCSVLNVSSMIPVLQVVLSTRCTYFFTYIYTFTCEDAFVFV